MVFVSRRILRRGFLVAFAIWFAFLSVAIHGLHTHSEGQFDTEGIDGRVVEQAGGAVRVTGAAEFEEGTSTDHSLCPACLFLKNCKQSATVWTSKVASTTPDGRALEYTDVCHVSHVVSPGSPRAPPILLT